MTNPRPVLLVGSIPGASSSAVFELLGAKLGKLAKRIPDGETGARAAWIAWQGPSFRGVDGLEPGMLYERGPGDQLQTYKVRAGAKESLQFGSLGYASAAIQSYQDFKRLRSEGKIAEGTRFQVCLPTPLAVVWAFIEPESVADAWPAYETGLAKEVDQIAAAIPHRDLAFQWDIAVEPVFILGQPDQLARFPLKSLLSSVARMSEHVPAEAELGLHLCFGDTAQKYSMQADDLGMLVEFANQLTDSIKRPIAWLHMPVPPKQEYDKFLSPLKNLKLGSGTELYLGLVGQTDGLEGARQRLTAAKRIVADFGIATECGLGRRPPETLLGLLDLHRELAVLP